MEHRCVHDKDIFILQKDMEIIIERVDKVEENNKAQQRMAEAIIEMATNMKHFGEDISHVKEDISTVKTDVSALKNESNVREALTWKEKYEEAKNELGWWDKYKFYIITTVLGLLIGRLV